MSRGEGGDGVGEGGGNDDGWMIEKTPLCTPTTFPRGKFRVRFVVRFVVRFRVMTGLLLLLLLLRLTLADFSVMVDNPYIC